MNYYYENMLIIPKKNEMLFIKDKKKDLNLVEKIGLETILCDFVNNYELCSYGEIYNNVKDFIRYNEDDIDILDGYYDTYVFDNYAIGDIWMTKNGIAVLTVADLSTYEDYNDNMSFEEVVEKCDIWCDCETRYINLM